MTSNLASEEIADHGLQLRHEAEEVSKKRKSGTLGITYSILAHKIRISAVYTYMRKFYLTYPILIHGKDKDRAAALWKRSDVIVMTSCYVTSQPLQEFLGAFYLNMKMRYLIMSKKKQLLFM